MEIVRLGQPTKGLRKKEEQKENLIVQMSEVQPVKLPVAAIQGVSSHRQYCVSILSDSKQTGWALQWSAGRPRSDLGRLRTCRPTLFLQGENNISRQE